MLTTILIVVLIIFLIGGLPNTGIVNYGYGPSGILSLVLAIVLILALTGHHITF